jgi:uncharacterized protein (TIGR03084 family)
MQKVFEDLAAEGDDVDRLVAGLNEEQWRTPTAAAGWTVADQVAHLTFIFELAGTAAADPARFQKMIEGAQDDFSGAVNAALAPYRALSPADLLRRWRDQRAATVAALAACPAGTIVPWLVRPLTPDVLACAGIMELYGHGQDIADALGANRDCTAGLEHLVGFAVLTRDFAYQTHGQTPADHEFRFELTGPAGELWTYGPESSPDRVTGSALGFCLLVTRRRHRDDTDVVASGADADHWLDIAQAYRGPAGPGRRAGQFAAAQ